MPEMSSRFLSYLHNPQQGHAQDPVNIIARIAWGGEPPEWERLIENSIHFENFLEETDDLTLRVGQAVIVIDSESQNVVDAFIHIGYGYFMGRNDHGFYFYHSTHIHDRYLTQDKKDKFQVKKVHSQNNQNMSSH